MFETSSDTLHKSMFYNIFLDLHQNKKIRQGENKQEWQEMKRMTRQETRWQKKSEASFPLETASHNNIFTFHDGEKKD